jgi:hypothetical protein
MGNVFPIWILVPPELDALLWLEGQTLLRHVPTRAKLQVHVLFTLGGYGYADGGVVVLVDGDLVDTHDLTGNPLRLPLTLAAGCRRFTVLTRRRHETSCGREAKEEQKGGAR